MEAYHNSHDLKDRNPFGAVAAGEQVTLSLTVYNPEPGINCYVRLWENNKGASLIPMDCVDWEESARFTVSFHVPEEGTLLWYSFVVETYDCQRIYYGNNSAGIGGVGQMYESSPKSYQITVYVPNSTPEWYKNGIAYQIFPDRFHRGEDWLKCQEKSQKPYDWKGAKQILQKDWSDTPFYCRNESGEVTRWPVFGGTLEGIREKLLYLKSLGVTVLYLNPIFEAVSNHKYDTGDYFKIDPSFGDDESFQRLIRCAEELNIKIILDGVFSHTGSDSKYFNRMGNYDTIGACQDKKSIYYPWYNFDQWPNSYDSWWGVADLPNVTEMEPSYRDFIFRGEDSVIRHWMKMGIRGWRLDVADELPDEFICGIRETMQEIDPDSVLIGEVWEDASNKISYGKLREYFLGKELQSVMNYPARMAEIDFILGRIDADLFQSRIMSLKENYPKENFYGALNLIGSHDRERILTILGEAPLADSLNELQREQYRLPKNQLQLGLKRLKLMSLIQFTMPGIPCIYYGDEVGMQGYADPYNRGTYPWGHEDMDLFSHYRMLTTMRQQYPVFSTGEYEIQTYGKNIYGCRRWGEDAEVQVLANRSVEETGLVQIPSESVCALELTTAKWVYPDDQKNFSIELPPLGFCVLLFQNDRPVPIKRDRSAGVLCHLSSIPGKQGKAVISDGYSFVDFLGNAGMKIWQMLPLNPVGPSNSPYFTSSVFAFNSELIDRNHEPNWDGYQQFCEDNAFWLDDYALFMAIRDSQGGKPWQEWSEEEKGRHNLKLLHEKYAEEEDQYRRDQYWFWCQWMDLKAYANKNGILMIGDVPLGASDDSADVWAHQELFQLDSRGYPKVTAGVPPDYFTEDGQNWGNPVYEWEEHARQGYDWWIKRLQWAIQTFDWIRLDHFRGFSEYFSIPIGRNGRWGGWRLGPGLDLFQAAEKKLGKLPILAEDLGQLDAGVYRLLALTGFSGIDVYQFSHDTMFQEESEIAENRVFYSSTHDSQTLAGWCAENDEDAETAIHSLYRSHALWVMFQLQDLLGLDDKARFNTPGTISEENWKWQASAEQLNADVAKKFRNLAKESRR